MRREGAVDSEALRVGFFSRRPRRDCLRFSQIFGSIPHVQCNSRDSSARLCSTFVLQQRPPPNRSVELTATRRTPIFSDD